MSDSVIIAGRRGDGTIVRVLLDGGERPFPLTPIKKQAMATTGERVKRARTARAPTQAELTESTGIEEATISRIASNKSTPQQSMIKKLALVLQADPGWLLIGEGVDRGKLAA